MEKRRIWLLLLMFVAGVMVLSACSVEEKGVETEEGQGGQKRESSADLSQFSAAEGDTWKESWSEETAGGDTVQVNLLAETVLPDLKQMSTVEVRPFDLGEDNKKKLADALFDSGWKETKKKYQGTRDGIGYELEIDADDKGSSIFFSSLDGKDVYPERIKGKGDTYYYYPVTAEREAENECRLTEEEADKTARAFLQKIGFSDLIQTKAELLQWEEVETDENGKQVSTESRGENFIDGWNFTYGQGVDGAAFGDFVVHGEPVHGDHEEVTSEGYSDDCSMHVAVTDRGVIQAGFYSPIEILSVTPGVKLLPLDEIKKIMKSEIKQLAEFNCTKRKKYTMKFEFLELIYYRVTDPENVNQFTYIPAWRLRDHKGYEPPFVVNAMDGSVVDDWEETWKIIKVRE